MELYIPFRVIFHDNALIGVDKNFSRQDELRPTDAVGRMLEVVVSDGRLYSQIDDTTPASQQYRTNVPC